MATEILMPALSPTMEEGTLAKWLVKEGDAVKSGDILAEIETDKATMEFEAVDEGTIGRLMVAEGTQGVKVNTPIAVLLEDGESMDDAAAPKGEGASAPAAQQPAARPATEEKVTEQKPAGGKPATNGASSSGPERNKGARVFASPLARRIAAEKGIDLAAISGTGPKGRIVKADLDRAQPGSVQSGDVRPDAAHGAAGEAGQAAPAISPVAAQQAGMSYAVVAKMLEGRETQEVQLDGMRRTIAARLSEAKQTIPHFYLRRSAKLDALIQFRGTLNQTLESRGVKLSINDFIIKACALALQQNPDANAVWAGDRIIKLKPSDVAVAVAVEGGLFTPVLQDADKKTLSALSAEMKDLAARAKTRKLAPHEYQGGSFAISNLGMYGIENFDAVINPPHGAILAVGAGIPTPVVENGEIVVRTMMSMTLSVDHRVIDGALGAQLLDAIVGNLENPVGMLA